MLIFYLKYVKQYNNEIPYITIALTQLGKIDSSITVFRADIGNVPILCQLFNLNNRHAFVDIERIIDLIRQCGW